MVFHILKDGTVVKDISKRIVKVEDAKSVYGLMATINSKPRKQKEIHKVS